MTGKPRPCTVRGRRLWYLDDRDPLTGKRKRVFFATKAEADAKQQEVNRRPKTQAVLHPLVDPDVTLGAFAADWFWTNAMGGGWRVATRRSYGEHPSDRLCPFDLGGGLRLGDVRVRDLHGGHVEALVTGLRNGGYAPDTVRSVHRLFVTLLNRAVARGLLGRHPLDAELRKELAKHMKATKPPVKAFTEEQARRFLTVAREKSRLYPLYLTGFLAGLRLGELCGLQLDDDRWDLVNGERRRQLHVDRSLSQLCSARNPEPGPTKSGKTRTVNVANELGTLFDRIKTERPKQAMARGWRPVPPWMFVTPSNGTPFNQTNIYKDFMRMLDVAGFKEGSGFSPHSRDTPSHAGTSPEAAT